MLAARICSKHMLRCLARARALSAARDGEKHIEELIKQQQHSGGHHHHKHAAPTQGARLRRIAVAAHGTPETCIED